VNRYEANNVCQMADDGKDLFGKILSQKLFWISQIGLTWKSKPLDDLVYMWALYSGVKCPPAGIIFLKSSNGVIFFLGGYSFAGFGRLSRSGPVTSNHLQYWTPWPLECQAHSY